nr:acylneuraminate cytidylyltransferase family protein [Roseospira navarrensis]
MAVVPARGGSKSVPGKNIRSLGGRPLLAHTLAQAAAVPALDAVVVSTDDETIAATAAQYDGRVVHRPADLATDTAPTEWALLHALDTLEAAGEAFDYVMVLEPTSPFRRPATIAACMDHIVAHDGRSLMTVTESRANIGRVADGMFRPLVPGAPRRRQDRQAFHIESSTVYVARTDFLRATGSLVCDDWLAVVVDEAEAVDINTPLDFALAEAMLAHAESGRADSGGADGAASG